VTGGKDELGGTSSATVELVVSVVEGRADGVGKVELECGNEIGVDSTGTEVGTEVGKEVKSVTSGVETRMLVGSEVGKGVKSVRSDAGTGMMETVEGGVGKVPISEVSDATALER